MPAIDNLFGNGAIHISDRNKKTPIATLCGQALDKETIRFFENADNFDQATCKVCRKSFFDETWTGETKELIAPPPEENQTQTQQEETPPVRTNLFANLQKPVNAHKEQLDGS